MVPLVDPNVVKPGWTAAIIVVLLIGATFFLWRNMGRQLKKIDFEELGRPRGGAGTDGTDGTESTESADGATDGSDESSGTSTASDVGGEGGRGATGGSDAAADDQAEGRTGGRR